LVVLETLSPDERAVFVLHEVFGFSHDEIASIVGKSANAVRQMAYRAREHVQSRRGRMKPVDFTTSMRIAEQFMTTAATGDMEQLLAMLAPDATWTADSGGKAPAVRRPVAGAKKVAALIVSFLRRGPELLPALRFETVNCNNAPAVVIYDGDELLGVFLVEVVDAKITNFYAMANPEKLAGIARPHTIRR
ncbi:MAG: nuclear transport factor 2 family protein, partial [Actinomycetota bacterium]|nr:nuclear transport factor 2 family protein [Actinomycetota bacterium]